MYAVVRTGGKQYRVQSGSVLEVEKLPGEVGDNIQLSEVLMVADGEKVTVGRPLVDGALVSGEIVAQGRGPKLLVFKKKRRQGYQKTQGHRQSLTKIQVKDIKA
jgi:large subunit ribosomal protein L21